MAESPWRPFRHQTYAVLWTATLVANIGAWMYSAAAAWLMTSLDPDPLMVSLVQVATTLPLCLFALPAGALADILDTRRFLIGAECFTTAAAALLAVMISFDQVTPATLLLFTFLVEAGFAVSSPAWQSIVPQLVPREDLPQAVAMNSVAVNISRALGPAAAGALTSVLGVAAPFWVNAVANLGSIAGLSWWRSTPRPASRLPAERLLGAMSTGLRHARYNRPLRAALLRAIGFFLFASCYWALLPLVARNQLSGGATLYGVLLGAIGASAIAGALALPRLERALGADRLVAAGAIGTAVALALYGIASNAATALAASLVAGFSWVAVLATLNVSAQFALAEWVRARGLSVYVAVAFGAMTLGSVLWGEVARHTGLALTHLIAAAGTLVTAVATWRWKPLGGAALDLTPSLHWPTPLVGAAVADEDGPVMVSIEYRVAAAGQSEFLERLSALSHARRRNGAYAWGVFQDVAVPGRVVEVFMVESWAEHLRQHGRVTNADRILEEQIRPLLMSEPTVTHLVAARAPNGDGGTP